MPAAKKRKKNTDDDVVGVGDVQPASNWLLGFAYVNEKGVEVFRCLEPSQKHPGMTCHSKTILNKAHSHNNHKHKMHPQQDLEAGGLAQPGLTRFQIKSAKIDVECKHCPGSKLTNPHSLVQHYRADKPKHGFKATEMEIFGDYPQLAFLLPAEKEKKDQKRKTSPEPETREAKKAKH